MKKSDEVFKDKILKEIDSVKVENFDKFYDIIKEFFQKAYNIKYQFTLDELGMEIEKKEKDPKVKKFMEHFIAEVQKVEFTDEKITKDQLNIVKSVFKRLVDLISVELEEQSEIKKVKSMIQKRVEVGVTVLLFLILLVVLVLYFVRINFLGFGGTEVIEEVFTQEVVVENRTVEIIENDSGTGNIALDVTPPDDLT